MARGERGAGADGDGDGALDALYAGAPEDFVAERDALAKRLRADGDRDGAARVKALRRPTVPAAAINRAVRREPDLAKAVVAAGERLGAAQEAALGGDGSDLRAAMGAESEAVERLVDLVAGESDLAPAMVDRARDTIRAGGRSAELRDEFLAGRLARDAEAVGFGGELAQADPPSERAKGGAGQKPERKSRSTGSKSNSKTSGARQRSKASGPGSRSKPKQKGPSAAELRRAEQRVTRAEKALEAAASAADEAREGSAEAESAATEAEEGIAAAEREISDARERLRRHEREHEKAQRRLARAEAKAEQAEDRRAEREAELERARAALPE